MGFGTKLKNKSCFLSIHQILTIPILFKVLSEINFVAVSRSKTLLIVKPRGTEKMSFSPGELGLKISGTIFEISTCRINLPFSSACFHSEVIKYFKIFLKMPL